MIVHRTRHAVSRRRRTVTTLNASTRYQRVPCHAGLVQRLDVTDLVDGAARLELSSNGVVEEPVVAVDLDGADWSLAPRVMVMLAAQRNKILINVTSTVFSVLFTGLA